MPCPDCNGSGKCPKCGGSGNCPKCGGGGGANGFGLIPGTGMGQGMGKGGPPQGPIPPSPFNAPRWGGVKEQKNPTDTRNTRIRARQLAQGMIDQIFIRGLPPGDNKIKMKYEEALQEMESSPDSVREKEFIPREDRDLVRQYNNAIKGVE